MATGSPALHYDADVFRVQFPVARRFIYHLTFYRILRAAYAEQKLESEFWAPTTDAHLLQAAILWCIVFGSDGSSSLHWKHLNPQDAQSLQADFRQKLVRRLSINWGQWEIYWKDMVDFRNRYAAHRDGYDKPVPNFDMALEVAYFYDEWVRQVISPDLLEEPPLKMTAARLQNDCTPLIAQLLQTTKNLSKPK